MKRHLISDGRPGRNARYALRLMLFIAGLAGLAVAPASVTAADPAAWHFTWRMVDRFGRDGDAHPLPHASLPARAHGRASRRADPARS